ncbi:unnamed protein product, partial [Iphiclides podalirius]
MQFGHEQKYRNVVDTTMVDTTMVDTTMVDTTMVDATVVDTTMVDTSTGKYRRCTTHACSRRCLRPISAPATRRNAIVKHLHSAEKVIRLLILSRFIEPDGSFPLNKRPPGDLRYSLYAKRPEFSLRCRLENAKIQVRRATPP